MTNTGGIVMASLAALAIAASAACGGAAGPVVETIPAPADSAPPAPPPEQPTILAPASQPELLDPALILSLPAPERDAWMRYIAASRAKRGADDAAMDAELEALGTARLTQAPYIRQAFEVTRRMTAEWFRSDSGRRLAESILSFQTPSGGWSKHVDFAAGPREKGQGYWGEGVARRYIGTIDNGSTTNQLVFLAAAHAATGEERYRAAFLRGIDYLLDAQYPNGCYPQVYPLQGGYHDAATFNDDATVNVLRIFRDIGRDRYPLVPADVRARVAAGLERGIDCLVESQIVVAGKRTAWAQQHHPITLAPIPARSYELVGLSGRESAGIAEFLMSISRPQPEAIEAVHAAVDWLRKTQIHGYVYDFERGLEARPGAGPLWARLYEIGTDRPIFSNRDGVKLYDWNQLTDRRQGYGWFGTEARDVLKKYDETWAQRYPRQASSGAVPGPAGKRAVVRESSAVAMSDMPPGASASARVS